MKITIINETKKQIHFHVFKCRFVGSCVLNIWLTLSGHVAADAASVASDAAAVASAMASLAVATLVLVTVVTLATLDFQTRKRREKETNRLALFSMSPP
jgi:hypothetical protein